MENRHFVAPASLEPLRYQSVMGCGSGFLSFLRSLLTPPTRVTCMGCARNAAGGWAVRSYRFRSSRRHWVFQRTPKGHLEKSQIFLDSMR